MKYWSNVHGWANSVYGDIHDYWTHWVPHHSTSPAATATTTAEFTTTSTPAPTSTPIPALTTSSDTFDEILSFTTTSIPITSPETTSFAANDATPMSTEPEPVSSSLELSYTTNITDLVTPTPSLAPNTSSSTSEPAAGESRPMFIALVIACVFLGLILLYLLIPFFMRLGIFVCNVVQLLFKRQGSFSDDGRMGLTSNTFDISGNLENDEREGLDKKSKLRILIYMLFYAETFDEARFRLVRYQFAQNGIAPDGQPLDPKSVQYDV